MARTWRVGPLAGAVGCGALVVIAVVGGPTATPTSAAAAPVGGVFVPAPLPRVRGVSHGARAQTSASTIKVAGSLNWSGYAQSSKVGIFTSVEDTWKVPVVSTAPSGEQFSSDWVGIDGFSTRDLVQAGTEADNIDGTPLYRAWTEILPASEDPLSMTISPGDSITTLVKETAPNTWLMQVTDNSTSVTQSRTVSYSAAGHSAEAIHERPCSGSPCTLDTLTKTSTVTFDPGTYTSTLQRTPKALLVPAVQSEKVTKRGLKTKTDKLYRLEMISSNRTSMIASPSVPDSDGDGFAVAYGATAPPAPHS